MRAIQEASAAVRARWPIAAGLIVLPVLAPLGLLSLVAVCQLLGNRVDVVDLYGVSQMFVVVLGMVQVAGIVGASRRMRPLPPKASMLRAALAYGVPALAIVLTSLPLMLRLQLAGSSGAVSGASGDMSHTLPGVLAFVLGLELLCFAGSAAAAPERGYESSDMSRWVYATLASGFGAWALIAFVLIDVVRAPGDAMLQTMWIVLPTMAVTGSLGFVDYMRDRAVRPVALGALAATSAGVLTFSVVYATNADWLSLEARCLLACAPGLVGVAVAPAFERVRCQPW